MKVKLLKKVRRRFDIIHMPNGYVDYENSHYNYNLFKLVDNKGFDGWGDRFVQLGINENTSQQFCSTILHTEKECIDFLKEEIIKILSKEGYKGRKKKNAIISQNKVWYNKK